MLMVYSKALAIVLLMISLFCLGTWPAFLAHAEHRGRKPPHAFLDYAVTFLITAMVATTLFGSIGTVEPNIADQLPEDNGACVGWALAGGVLLMMGNLSLQYGIAMVGMTVCLPLQASLTVIIGTVLNYFLDGKLNKAALLFPGVGCFLVAIVLDAAAHQANSAAQMLRLRTSGGKDDVEKSTKDAKVYLDDKPGVIKSPPHDYSVHSNDMAMVATMGDAKTVEMRSLNIKSKSVFAGVLVSAIGGCCFGFFGPAFNLASNDQFNLLPEGVRPLTVWTGYFYFSIAFVATAVVVNIIFLYKPPFGLPKSSFMLYLKDNNTRWAPIIAGFICSVGNILQFLGGQAAGYAASDVVQAYPLWSTILGYFWFKEYRNSSKKAYLLLLAMWLAYLAAVALLASSADLREA